MVCGGPSATSAISAGAKQSSVTDGPVLKAKRIAPGAYQALREALSVVFWYRRAFRNFVSAALRDHPEVLAPLNFEEPKRQVADALVDRLANAEVRYRDVTLDLMVALAGMTRFPDLEGLEDAPERVAQATAAVEELRAWTGNYARDLEERQRQEATWRALREQSSALRKFSDDVSSLHGEFLQLAAMTDAAERGRRFEGFLARLFALFDMQPRLAYVLEAEQIDGSLSFDTDDYIVEARWRNTPTSREHTDVFAAKVRRKGKNALGLFVSVQGFSQDALSTYAQSTPFLAIDGLHLMAVLEGRIRFDDLLRSMKRHANETGDCYLAPSHLLGH
jgi:hypothetical protein